MSLMMLMVTMGQVAAAVPAAEVEREGLIKIVRLPAGRGNVP